MKKKPVPFESRIAVAYIERFMRRHGITSSQIERGLPCWQTASGLVPLTITDIERLVSIEDPVVWAWLNLRESQSIPNEDGSVAIQKGAPWNLFECQARMARLTGNLIVECGAEVGKTRDIVLGTLWEIDTFPGGASDLIAADSDITLQEIWNEIEQQLLHNRRIGAGVVETSLKPYREMVFANGSRFQMRLCGHDGKQFRGGHFFPGIRADEVAKWKNQQQFNEFWRAGKPGSHFRLYSTPDGDYSSPFCSLCRTALPITGREPKATLEGEEPRFRKFNIPKTELPAPFWTDQRAAKYLEMYGGENSVGWQTNVLGKWGSPAYSVFPMPRLKPNLKYVPHFRMVVALIDRESARVNLRACRLSPEMEQTDAIRREEILTRDAFPLLSGQDVGAAIGAFFPPTHDWVDPLLFCGADLGSATDPSEFNFYRKIGERIEGVFRLHLRNADWPVQASIVMALDHASGHRVKYGFDNGSAGSALVQVLTQMEEFRTCPSCRGPVYFAERLHAFGFGDHCDEIDVATGETIPNPDKKDAAGNPTPRRLSNKEFSTRVLERWTQAAAMSIPHDEGCGDERLGAAQLLVNHTSMGETSKNGERRFKGQDDHFVDSLRQLALVIASVVRGDLWLPADPDMMVRIGDGRKPGGSDGSGGAAPLADFAQGDVRSTDLGTGLGGGGRLFSSGGSGFDW